MSEPQLSHLTEGTLIEWIAGSPVSKSHKTSLYRNWLPQFILCGGGRLGARAGVRCLLPWILRITAVRRPLLSQDLEKPTAVAYRMKGGGQPGGSGSGASEDTPRRPPDPKVKPSQYFLNILSD